MKRLTIALTDDQHAALEDLAKLRKPSIAALVVDVIDRLIDEARRTKLIPPPTDHAARLAAKNAAMTQAAAVITRTVRKREDQDQ